jgi:hypothetical protein
VNFKRSLFGGTREKTSTDIRRQLGIVNMVQEIEDNHKLRNECVIKIPPLPMSTSGFILWTKKETSVAHTKGGRPKQFCLGKGHWPKP